MKTLWVVGVTVGLPALCLMFFFDGAYFYAGAVAVAMVWAWKATFSIEGGE
jgi:hypothetical protein